MKRRRLLPFLLASLLSCMVAMGCGSGAPLAISGGERPDIDSGNGSNTSVTVTVSAAASLQDALDAIAPQFSAAYPNILVDYNFGSSGALQRQIEQGAPADVFFSAATKQMDALSEKGLIVPDSRQDLVANRLMLIAPTNTNLEITDLAQLKDADISRFAVGEFRSVPAGQYAEQVFQKLDLLEPLQSKFVFGNNVRSVLAAVGGGNAELGMVYATDAKLSNQVKVLATAPDGSHQPIVYPIAVVQNTLNPEAAQTFIEFLTTDTAQETFEEFGFGQI
ncbi:MAG: molybdate ABC transporter substrate-binding protein [Cyanobacteria bacterium P01_G01_bin.38]